MKTYRTYLFVTGKRYAFLCLLVFLATASATAATEPEAKPSIFSFWQEEGLQEITLLLNLEELEQNRRSDSTMQGQLVAAEHIFDISYEVGGRFRRVNCEMPPLRLHLNKKGLKGAGFSKHNDFKLVTHCNNDQAGEDALLREALAYELYRQLSPFAYQSQLVKVNYVNTADGSTTSAFGLLIEDTDELKARTKLKSKKEAFNLPLESMNNAEMLTLFQYMLGNADFSLIMQRNVKFLQDKAGRITIVPYDFDYSGFVRPAYAKPDASRGQRSIQDRIWIWDYSHEPNMKEARKHFLDARTQLLDTVANFPNLSEESKKEIRQYIRDFYTELRSGEIGAVDMK